MNALATIITPYLMKRYRMNMPTITQIPLQSQLSYAGLADTTPDTRRKLDGLAIVIAALMNKGDSPDWREIATAALFALVGDLQKQAALLDTFLLETG